MLKAKFWYHPDGFLNSVKSAAFTLSDEVLLGTLTMHMQMHFACSGPWRLCCLQYPCSADEASGGYTVSIKRYLCRYHCRFAWEGGEGHPASGEGDD